MNILFLCVGNSARSQMAEGFAKVIFGDKARIRSAGSKPGSVNRFAVEVMQEAGVDISRQFSKSVDAIDLGAVDYVVRLCREEVCPVLPSRAKELHWPIPDPERFEGSEEAKLAAFREVREMIRRGVEELAKSLLGNMS